MWPQPKRHHVFALLIVAAMLAVVFLWHRRQSPFVEHLPFRYWIAAAPHSQGSAFKKALHLRVKISGSVNSSLAEKGVFSPILASEVSPSANIQGSSVRNETASDGGPGALLTNNKDTVRSSTAVKDLKIRPGLSALDPLLVAEVRDRMLVPPSHLPYELSEPNVKDPSVGQATLVLEILRNKTRGTYIECGALDGETRSNTLYMERSLGWRGLLVEADPSNFEKLKAKHRKAWSINACLSGNTVSQVAFKQDFNMGKIEDERATPSSWNSGHQTSHHVNVLCIPLETMLDTLGWGTVDYFSLDVEGHEYAVLKELPFDRLNIKTLSVEFRHVPEGKEAIRTLMESHGYEVYDELTHWNDLANDFIFKKKGL